MNSTVTEKSEIIHTIPGRIRIHLPAWEGQGKRSLEAQVLQFPGVQRVQANGLTRNLLIIYDLDVTDDFTLLKQVHSLDLHLDEEPEPEHTPVVSKEQQGAMVRARITVRGLNRDPQVARRLVERLERHRNVHIHVSPLTGRVLVKFTEQEVVLDDILSDVASVELPDLPEEDTPADPLDPGPLFQGVVRSIGSFLGLGLLAVLQIAGAQGQLPGADGALQMSSILGIFQGIPPIRYGLRKLLGRTIADLLINIPAITALTFAGSSLGLTLIAGESVRLATEVSARQTAWRKYEEQVSQVPWLQPDQIIHVDAGEQLPLPAKVIEGTGTAFGRDANLLPLALGSVVPAGVRLYGGPFSLKVEPDQGFTAFTPESRPEPVRANLLDRYLQFVGPISLLCAAGTALITRSWNLTLASFLLVNPRVAAIGNDNADIAASARILRAGVTIVGTRPKRTVRLPHALFLDGGRLLTEHLELLSTLPLTEQYDNAELQARAAGISAAAGSPWGNIFLATGMMPASNGSFNGKVARATLDGLCYTLGPVEDHALLPEAIPLYQHQRGNYILVLKREQDSQLLGLFVLRPKLAPNIEELVSICQRCHVELAVLGDTTHAALSALSERANIRVIHSDDAVEIIRARQQQGLFVAFVSDNMGATAAFGASDLAISMTDGRSHFPAPADLLAPDFVALTAIIDAGARREATVHDSIGLSAIANVIGAFLGLRGVTGIEQASRTVYITAIGTLIDGYLRLRGGKRPETALAHLTDPHPERWGQRSTQEILHQLETSEEGLSSEQAQQRRQLTQQPLRRHSILSDFLEQVRSPLNGILAIGAGVSLLLGSTGDILIIVSTIAANIAVGVWQEYKANCVSETLERFGAGTATVLRDGKPVTLTKDDVVAGDILLLAPGEQVVADARIISAQNLEVDEASLTGESLPVPKKADGDTDASHVVLAGSAVTTGLGRAVVVAVGRETRLGATTAALAIDTNVQNPLAIRLSHLLRLSLPISIGGGVLVIFAGILRGQPLATLAVVGATLALTAVPEGLPLLARVSEAGVARRLSEKNAIVRRLSVVEALGRVDIACTDKTGTLTEGHLSLSLLATSDHEERKLARDASGAEELSTALRSILLTGALACPHPDSSDVRAHPTDVAVMRGAMAMGLHLHQTHEKELSFDPVRSFHAVIVQGRLCMKGAPEALIPRCDFQLWHGKKEVVGDSERNAIHDYATELAGRGLRVLMVVEGPADTPLDDPQGLTVLGFIGISDPLRPNVSASVKRCQEAGVRVIMITGDHPATARTIGIEAGLLYADNQVATGAELAELHNSEFADRLEQITIVARATPLDKLRIIEGLQQRGHTVAMTGDGVNDAPALRLANVGVSMGQVGTEVARQTADLVLTDDNFVTLVDVLIEGRSFWRNIRRALGLLLGGNLGELGLVTGASLLGLAFPLTTSQILAMNAITDILPATAVALQQPEHRHLASLVREGDNALDAPLRNDILYRSSATAIPSLIAYGCMLALGTVPQAQSVAYGSVIATQLAQTLDIGRSEGNLTRSVGWAVAGSAAVLLATYTVPPLRTFLSLVMPPPIGLVLIGGAAITAVALSRFVKSSWFEQVKEQTQILAVATNGSASQAA